MTVNYSMFKNMDQKQLVRIMGSYPLFICFFGMTSVSNHQVILKKFLEEFDSCGDAFQAFITTNHFFSGTAAHERCAE